MAKKQKTNAEVSTMKSSNTPSQVLDHDAIASRAYQLYLARGRADGHDVEDWIRAERACADATRSSRDGE